MNSEQRDDIQRLSDSLDQAIPPHQDTVGNLSGDPLVEAAGRIARLPKAKLSQDSTDLLEAKLRAYAEELGPPRHHLQRRRGQNGQSWLLPLAASILVLCIGASLLQFAPETLTGSGGPAPTVTPSTAPPTTAASLTPTATETPSEGELIEGEIQEIDPGRLTLNDATYEIPQETIEALNLAVGDHIRIEGYGGGQSPTITVIARAVPTQTSSPDTSEDNEDEEEDDSETGEEEEEED